MQNTEPSTGPHAPIATQSSPAPRGRCLIALTDEHLQEFFPGGLLEELKQTVSEWRQVSKDTDPDGSQLRAAIETFQPDILLGGWSTPELPVSIFGPDGPVRYLCSTVGSIRHLVGLESIQRGLLVSNWGTSISRTIAECALMLILSCLRSTPEHHEAMHHNGGWRPSASGPRQLSLFERRVGIHGCGKIARELVALLRPFNCTISTYCPSASDDYIAAVGIKRVHSLAELFANNDVLVELEGLTPESYHSVTEAILRMIPDEGVLVNVGRGAVIDEAALSRVAAEGRIRIGLDVYEEEPLPVDSPLRKNLGAVLIPHLAGPTADRVRDAGAHAIQNIKNYLTDQPISGQITAELYQYMT